jgi:hypothetical protein
VTPSNVHIHGSTVTVECDNVRAAVELAERLIEAKPAVFIRLDSLRRLIADPTQTTLAVGRSLASEDMIGMHVMPQAPARRQALEEAIQVVAYEALAEPARGTSDEAYNSAIKHAVEALQRLLNK